MPPGFAEAALDEDLDAVLNFYQCYRACVRGKINGLAAAEPEVPPAAQARAREAARAYFALAGAYARKGAQWTAAWW